MDPQRSVIVTRVTDNRVFKLSKMIQLCFVRGLKLQTPETDPGRDPCEEDLERGSNCLRVGSLTGGVAISVTSDRIQSVKWL